MPKRDDARCAVGCAGGRSLVERPTTDQMLRVVLGAVSLPVEALGGDRGARELRAMLFAEELRASPVKLQVSFSSPTGQFVCELVMPDGRSRVVRGWHLDDCLEWMYDVPDYRHSISLDENACGICDECHGDGMRFRPLRDDEPEPEAGTTTSPAGLKGTLMACACQRAEPPKHGA